MAYNGHISNLVCGVLLHQIPSFGGGFGVVDAVAPVYRGGAAATTAAAS